MNTFQETFGFVGAICAGIAILAVFFTGLGYFKKGVRGPGVKTLSGFIRDGKLVNVHLSGSRTLEGVRFIGVTESNSIKGEIPYQLTGMVVFETKSRSRVMVRGDSVKMIEESEQSA